MRLFDTHCHLLWRAAEDPPAQQIARAQTAGVSALLCVATDADSARGARDLARSHPDAVRASVGLHPNDAGDAATLTERLHELAELARSGGFAAVGETGLDFYRDTAAPEQQERALLFQLDLARDVGLPAILHCRQAAPRLAELLAARAPVSGVMHCFSEGPEWVETFVGLGLHVSFAGNLTYPKAEAVREAARRVPGERLLIETDAPFLPPQPRRGQPNEPAYVRMTLETLAKVRGEAPAAVAAATWTNAAALFGAPACSAAAQ